MRPGAVEVACARHDVSAVDQHAATTVHAGRNGGSLFARQDAAPPQGYRPSSATPGCSEGCERRGRTGWLRRGSVSPVRPRTVGRIWSDGGAPRTVGGAGAAFLILCAAECPAAERANRARRRDDDAAGESLRSKGATERREGATQAAPASSLRGSGDWLPTVGRTRCCPRAHGRHSPPRVG